MYKVNKQRCVGCQICLQACPGATRIGDDGKAEVIDQEKLEKCGGEKVCPIGAIEKVSSGEEGQSESKFSSTPPSEPPATPPANFPFAGGRGMGRGLGRGMGRGLGRGPRRWPGNGQG